MNIKDYHYQFSWFKKICNFGLQKNTPVLFRYRFLIQILIYTWRDKKQQKKMQPICNVNKWSKWRSVSFNIIYDVGQRLLPLLDHQFNPSLILRVRLDCTTAFQIHKCCVVLSYSPGLQSVNREQMESRTLEMVRAGLQLSFRMSRQITPWLLMLQW